MIITQMFFDVEVFLQFVRDCRAAGINVPILPGLMLIQNYGGFNRMSAFCKSRVPADLRASLEAIKDDDAAIIKAGIDFGVSTCKAIMAAGMQGLHFYTLNTEPTTLAILDGLGLKKAIPETA
jgi:methylenetetrahydrofolate reductase (NADPH)